MTELRAVFFDLDGTLIHDGAGEAVRRTARMLGERHGLDPQRILAANDGAWRDCWAEQGERWMRGELGEDDALPREIWRLTLAGVGEGAERMLEEAVAFHLAAERTTFSLYEETIEVLERVRAAGLGVGIITNGPGRFQRDKIDSVGIAGLVDSVVASGDLGVLKPDPAIFGRALGELDATAAQAVHVGDNFTADVVGAHRAGMAAVWINRDVCEAPDRSIPHRDSRSLREVLDVVGAGEAAG